MRAARLTLVALPFLANACLAQTNTLRVFSEFTRIDPFGQIVPQDRGSAEPRSILSPGVPRNAFSSFRIAITLDKPAKYILDIGQNPENAVKSTLYRERFEKHGESWIPDGLQQVKIPYEGEFPDTEISRSNNSDFLAGYLGGENRSRGHALKWSRNYGLVASMTGSPIRWKCAFWTRCFPRFNPNPRSCRP